MLNVKESLILLVCCVVMRPFQGETESTSTPSHSAFSLPPSLSPIVIPLDDLNSRERMPAYKTEKTSERKEQKRSKRDKRRHPLSIEWEYTKLPNREKREYKNTSNSSIQRWTLYYEKKSKTKKGQYVTKDNFLRSLLKAGDFEKSREVVSYCRSLCSRLHFSSYPSLYVFKFGIEPVWEDPSNEFGGKWYISCPDQSTTSRWWQILLSEFLAGRLGYRSQLCGIVLQIRPWGNAITIWNKNSSDKRQIEYIKSKILFLLAEPKDLLIRYCRHSKTSSPSSTPPVSSSLFISSSLYNTSSSSSDFSDESTPDHSPTYSPFSFSPPTLSPLSSTDEVSWAVEEFISEEREMDNAITGSAARRLRIFEEFCEEEKESSEEEYVKDEEMDKIADEILLEEKLEEKVFSSEEGHGPIGDTPYTSEEEVIKVEIEEDLPETVTEKIEEISLVEKTETTEVVDNPPSPCSEDNKRNEKKKLRRKRRKTNSKSTLPVVECKDNVPQPEEKTKTSLASNILRGALGLGAAAILMLSAFSSTIPF